MAEIAQSIDLKIPEKLRDPEYRKKFFLAESSARIAGQLIALRKKRGLSQTELAARVGTRQPAISRVESADYNNWSFNTLRSIADKLDARIRVSIQPSEEILAEYDQSTAAALADDEIKSIPETDASKPEPSEASDWAFLRTFVESVWAAKREQDYLLPLQSISKRGTPSDLLDALRNALSSKDREIELLKEKLDAVSLYHKSDDTFDQLTMPVPVLPQKRDGYPL